MFQPSPHLPSFIQMSQDSALALIHTVLSDELPYEDRAGLLWIALAGAVFPEELDEPLRAAMRVTITLGYDTCAAQATAILDEAIAAEVERGLSDLTNGS